MNTQDQLKSEIEKLQERIVSLKQAAKKAMITLQGDKRIMVLASMNNQIERMKAEIVELEAKLVETSPVEATPNINVQKQITEAKMELERLHIVKSNLMSRITLLGNGKTKRHARLTEEWNELMEEIKVAEEKLERLQQSMVTVVKFSPEAEAIELAKSGTVIRLSADVVEHDFSEDPYTTIFIGDDVEPSSLVNQGARIPSQEESKLRSRIASLEIDLQKVENDRTLGRRRKDMAASITHSIRILKNELSFLEEEGDWNRRSDRIQVAEEAEAELVLVNAFKISLAEATKKDAPQSVRLWLEARLDFHTKYYEHLMRKLN